VCTGKHTRSWEFYLDIIRGLLLAHHELSMQESSDVKFVEILIDFLKIVIVMMSFGQI
jgi:hypothetical protein